MKKIMFILFCGVIPFLLSSCSDDDDNGGTGSGTIRQITKLEVYEEIITYNYDSKNRLSSYVSKYDNSTSTETFEYDNNGKLVKLTSIDSSDRDGDYSYVEFSYNGNTVTATEHYKYNMQDMQDETIYVYTYTLNEKGLVTKKSTQSGYHLLYTYDNNNNLTKSEYYDGGNLIETETWEYDNKNSLMSNMGVPAWFFVAYNDDFSTFAGKNNAVKRTYKYKNNPIEEYEASYTYDADGYPTSYTIDGEKASVTYRTIK